MSASPPPPDRLTDAALFEREVPGSWRPLLEGLAQLESLMEEPPRPDAAGRLNDRARRTRAAAIVQRLLEGVAPLAGASPGHLQPGNPSHVRWFIEATLLWPDFARAGGHVLVDSHGSGTMARFEPDLRGEPGERAALRTALGRCFDLASADLAEIESSLARRVSNLRLKEAIASHLARELTAPEGTLELAQQILTLFQRLFGPLPVQPGDVDITLTSTAVIFGLPFEGGTLLRPDFAGRPEGERAAIGAFLQKVERQQSSFDSLRFPGFGLYERDKVDPTLLAGLTAAAALEPGLEEVRPQVVAETLATMVTLIPGQKSEMFLVHDLWGHGWEESLCDFEWSYARLIELRAPISPDTGTLFGGEGADPQPVLRDAFVVGEKGVILDREILSRVVKADLRGRIRLALNVVVAEALADLVEHKYVRRRRLTDPPMPSSSLLPEAPLKTDLSLRDTQSLLRAATRPYRRLLDSPAEARRLAEELAGAGVPRDGLAESMAVALEAIGIEFQPVLETRMAPPPPAGAAEPATLPVNLAQRVMLGMVALSEALGRFLEQADADCTGRPAGERWRCPRACIDLLVLLLGWFYEQDREIHFWHLDELLRQELLPTLLRLEESLRLV